MPGLLQTVENTKLKVMTEVQRLTGIMCEHICLCLDYTPTGLQTIRYRLTFSEPSDACKLPDVIVIQGDKPFCLEYERQEYSYESTLLAYYKLVN